MFTGQLKRFTYKNTLDLDHATREDIVKLKNKIERCNYLYQINFEDSTQKGFHAILKCKIKCDTCRFVFDDPNRYEMDFGKPRAFSNVLFKPFSVRRVNANRSGGKTLQPK